MKARPGDPTTVASNRYQRVRWGVVICEPTASKNDLGANGLSCARLDRRLLAGGVEVANRKVNCDLCRGFSDGLPASAPA
jgi:hypothetical protein|tara:strand:- start:301 stop:540 length:240 start_codon:yes stop_codon:yes gene_type:complete